MTLYKNKMLSCYGKFARPSTGLGVKNSLRKFKFLVKFIWFLIFSDYSNFKFASFNVDRYCRIFWKFHSYHGPCNSWMTDRKVQTRKGDNYSDVLPLKAARRDSISNSTSFRLRFESELQTNPMQFHLEPLWGATLMPHRGCAMDWDKTK